jgi:integrase/recombinase XerD
MIWVRCNYFVIHEDSFTGKRQVQKIVKRVAERVRISREVTPHVLRHTFATLALQKGISLVAIQKILGHDRLATTAIYSQPHGHARGREVLAKVVGLCFALQPTTTSGMMVFGAIAEEPRLRIP